MLGLVPETTDDEFSQEDRAYLFAFLIATVVGAGAIVALVAALSTVLPAIPSVAAVVAALGSIPVIPALDVNSPATKTTTPSSLLVPVLVTSAVVGIFGAVVLSNVLWNHYKRRNYVNLV